MKVASCPVRTVASAGCWVTTGMVSTVKVAATGRGRADGVDEDGPVDVAVVAGRGGERIRRRGGTEDAGEGPAVRRDLPLHVRRRVPGGRRRQGHRQTGVHRGRRRIGGHGRRRAHEAVEGQGCRGRRRGRGERGSGRVEGPRRPGTAATAGTAVHPGRGGGAGAAHITAATPAIAGRVTGRHRVRAGSARCPRCRVTGVVDASQSSDVAAGRPHPPIGAARAGAGQVDRRCRRTSAPGATATAVRAGAHGFPATAAAGSDGERRDPDLAAGADAHRARSTTAATTAISPPVADAHAVNVDTRAVVAIAPAAAVAVAGASGPTRAHHSRSVGRGGAGTTGDGGERRTADDGKGSRDRRCRSARATRVTAGRATAAPTDPATGRDGDQAGDGRCRRRGLDTARLGVGPAGQLGRHLLAEGVLVGRHRRRGATGRRHGDVDRPGPRRGGGRDRRRRVGGDDPGRLPEVDGGGVLKVGAGDGHAVAAPHRTGVGTDSGKDRCRRGQGVRRTGRPAR